MTLLDRILGRPEPKQPQQPDPQLLQPPDGFRDGVEAFAWRVLVDAYVRILARSRGRDPLTVGQAEAHDWLAPYHADLDRDVRALGAAIAQARTEGYAQIQAALHGAGLPHTDVDQAFARALESQKGGTK